MKEITLSLKSVVNPRVISKLKHAELIILKVPADYNCDSFIKTVKRFNDRALIQIKNI